MNTSDLQLDSYSKRREIREELQRKDAQGESLDPAVKCKCHCGNIHYRKREETKDVQETEVR